MTQAADVIEPITSRIRLPESVEGSLDPSLTGELRELASWWTSLGGQGEPVTRHILAPADLPNDAREALAEGARAADLAVDAGATVLVPRVTERDDLGARTVICVLTRVEAQGLVPQHEGLSDRAWMASVAEVRDRSARLTEVRGAPLDLLDQLPGPGLAFCTGVLLAGAARQTACLVDGTDELAGAVVADRLSASAKAWWLAATSTTDGARAAAIDRMGIRSALPLSLDDDFGWGARSAVALLRLATGAPD